jgi:hypothetical protein
MVTGRIDQEGNDLLPSKQNGQTPPESGARGKAHLTHRPNNLSSMSTMSERSAYEDDHESVKSCSAGDYSNPGSQSEMSESIAKAETKDIFRLKFVVATVLVCSAVGVALWVYLYVTWNEQALFEKQFDGDSDKILQALGASWDKTLGLMDGLAITLVSSARDKNQTWPCVTLPDFAVRMSKVVPLTDAVNINVLPIVTKETRQRWEAYTRDNDGWVNEAVAIQDNWDGYFGPIAYNGTHNHVIHGDFHDVPRNTRCASDTEFDATICRECSAISIVFALCSRMMLPLWQNFPVIANVSVSRLRRVSCTNRNLNSFAPLAEFLHAKLGLDGPFRV